MSKTQKKLESVRRPAPRFMAPITRGAKTGRAYCRYPDQREAFKLVGITAGDISRALGCSYLRARDLRGGAIPLRGLDLAKLSIEHPTAVREIMKTMTKDDVRRRQVPMFEDESDGT